MRLVRLLNSKIIGVKEEDGYIELTLTKNNKKYKVVFRGDVDYYHSDCTFEDEGCYDTVVVYEIEEV